MSFYNNYPGYPKRRKPTPQEEFLRQTQGSQYGISSGSDPDADLWGDRLSSLRTATEKIADILYGTREVGPAGFHGSRASAPQTVGHPKGAMNLAATQKGDDGEPRLEPPIYFDPRPKPRLSPFDPSVTPEDIAREYGLPFVFPNAAITKEHWEMLTDEARKTKTAELAGFARKVGYAGFSFERVLEAIALRFEPNIFSQKEMWEIEAKHKMGRDSFLLDFTTET